MAANSETMQRVQRSLYEAFVPEINTAAAEDIFLTSARGPDGSPVTPDLALFNLATHPDGLTSLLVLLRSESPRLKEIDEAALLLTIADSLTMSLWYNYDTIQRTRLEMGAGASTEEVWRRLQQYHTERRAYQTRYVTVANTFKELTGWEASDCMVGVTGDVVSTEGMTFNEVCARNTALHPRASDQRDDVPIALHIGQIVEDTAAHISEDKKLGLGFYDRAAFSEVQLVLFRNLDAIASMYNAQRGLAALLRDEGIKHIDLLRVLPQPEIAYLMMRATQSEMNSLKSAVSMLEHEHGYSTAEECRNRALPYINGITATYAKTEEASDEHDSSKHEGRSRTILPGFAEGVKTTDPFGLPHVTVKLPHIAEGIDMSTLERGLSLLATEAAISQGRDKIVRDVSALSGNRVATLVAEIHTWEKSIEAADTIGEGVADLADDLWEASCAVANCGGELDNQLLAQMKLLLLKKSMLPVPMRGFVDRVIETRETIVELRRVNLSHHEWGILFLKLLQKDRVFSEPGFNNGSTEAVYIPPFSGTVPLGPGSIM